MDEVARNYHLQNRQGVWYYRRRVPLDRVAAVGRAMIFQSLGTGDVKEARQRRDLKDVEWNARFEPHETLVSEPGPSSAPSASAAGEISQKSDRAATVRLIQDYVARMDARMEKRLEDHGPIDEDDRRERTADAAYELQILKDLDDPRSGAWIARAEQDVSQSGIDYQGAELLKSSDALDFLRRALIELTRRKMGRLNDVRDQAFFDPLFGPSKMTTMSFGKVADQFLREEAEEASSNKVTQKTQDRTKAQVALVRSLIGEETPIDAIDYDRCMEFRRILAKVPTNWNKHYKGLTLQAAMQRSQADGRTTLGAITQEQNLAAFRRIMDLAVRKGLINNNPAAGIRPMKRDIVALADKRRPFDRAQIIQFFGSSLYRDCVANGSRPYNHPKHGGWRFWLAPLMLFAGLRPNECCQALASDVKKTDSGTWYIEVTDEEGEEGVLKKSLKTHTSRRCVPVHPQLIRMGFLDFAEERRALGPTARLFDTPIDKYGNAASYPLKWFRDHYLAKAIEIEERQTFYSFRHSFRDALRRSGAHPDVLDALGWGQGSRVVSDNYGTKLDPDQLLPHIRDITYPGLDLSHLQVDDHKARDPSPVGRREDDRSACQEAGIQDAREDRSQRRL